MALQFDSDGWLIPGSDPSIVVRTNVRTQKKYPGFSKLVGGRPVGIVWHWTGGGYGDGKAPWLRDYMLEEVVDPTRKASWNFFLDRNGVLNQHASIYEGTWHVGMPGIVYRPVAGQAVPVPITDVNRALLGIEMENAGILLPQGGNWYAWPYGAGGSTCTGVSACSEAESFKNVVGGKVTFGDKYKLTPNRVTVWSNGTAYDTYTTSQVRVARELTRALKGALGWEVPEQVHYSHEQFIPKQKKDPGALWMDSILPDIERDVFGRAVGESGKAKYVFFALVGGAALYLGWRYRQGTLNIPQLRRPVSISPQLAR